MLPFLLFALASAQEPNDDVYTIIVEDNLSVFEAHDALTDELVAQGYHRDVQGDGDVIFRHGVPWRPVVVVTPEGHVRIRRRGFVWGRPDRNEGPNASPASTLYCLTPWTLVSCLSIKGLTTDKRIMQGRKTVVAASIHEQVVDLQDALANDAVDDRVQRDLHQIWVLGEGLDGSPLPTAAGRRAAIGTFWSTRLPTEWGRRAQVLIESFVLIVIQPSSDAFSAAEVRHWEAEEPTSRLFVSASPDTFEHAP